ncbi:MotA/TolQ/ExbB proton channel family protein [bacterium]|nr:MotA/TolQ/ExbB proton channel family protein [bacterium]
MHDALRFIQHSGPVARGVLIILAVLSVISWMVIFEKLIQFIKADGDDRRFGALYGKKVGWNGLYKAVLPLKNSPRATVFRRGYSELYAWRRKGETPADPLVPDKPVQTDPDPDVLSRIMDSAISESLGRLDRYLPALSITVSVSPFLGLFGTVWGVMTAFMSIGSTGSADITAVGPGIAEALITTVTGLAVAIPALVAYNIITARLRKLEERLTVFSTDLIRLFSRETGQ